MGEDSLIKTRKVIISIDRNIDRVLTVLFLIILLLGIYFAYDAYHVFTFSSPNSLDGYKPMNGYTQTLKTLSDDVVAWIDIYDTSIDYPIMQGKDNSEYLNRNAYGDYSLSGAIFLDSLNARDFSDDYNVIYGHHMSGGFMFGAIDAFEDAAYLDEHKRGLLTTIEGEMYDVTLFAFMQTDANESIVFDVTEEGDRHAFIAEHASIYRPAEGRIIALSTCKSPLTTERTVLFGVLSDYEEISTGTVSAESRGTAR
ncbi:MAG: class B sortase [Firmicutes bacterium]|nr:class B sortase [Bacillota bacterium]